MTGRQVITAWRPAADGIREVLHAQFVGHSYPVHTHDTWTLLIVDAGCVRYDLDRREHAASTSTVTLLPPHVPHDGRPAGPEGFRKRVLYLSTDVIDPSLIGAAVDQPAFRDPLLRHRIEQLHIALGREGSELEVESRLALVGDHAAAHLRRTSHAEVPSRDADLARRFRDLLDERLPGTVTLAEASRLLFAHRAHLVRCFSKEFGMPPHAYVTGRRVDLARRLLLGGHRPVEVATAVGFYDQSHLSRHFNRMLGVSPASYARGH
jgi:AraC-like DNA-binding protein